MASPTTCPTNVYDITSYNYTWNKDDGALLMSQGASRDGGNGYALIRTRCKSYIILTWDEDDDTLLHVWGGIGPNEDCGAPNGYYANMSVNSHYCDYPIIFAPYNKQISTAKNNFYIDNNVLCLHTFRVSTNLFSYVNGSYMRNSSADTRKKAVYFGANEYSYSIDQRLIKDGYKYKYDQESLIDSYASFYDYTKLSATSSGFYKPTFDCMGASEFTGLQPFEIIDFEANDWIEKMELVGKTFYIYNSELTWGSQTRAMDYLNHEYFDWMCDLFGYETLLKRAPFGQANLESSGMTLVQVDPTSESAKYLLRAAYSGSVNTSTHYVPTPLLNYLIVHPVCKIQFIPQAMKTSHKLYFFFNATKRSWSWSSNGTAGTFADPNQPTFTKGSNSAIGVNGRAYGYSLQLSFPHTLSLNYQAPRHLLESIYTAYYRGTKMKKQILPKPCICHCDSVAFPLSSQKTTEVSTATSYQYALTFEVIKVSKALETEDNSTTPTFIFTDEASLELPYSDDTSNPQWEKEFKIYTNADTLAFSTSDDNGNLQIPVEQYTSNVLVYDSTRGSLDAETAKTSIAKVTSAESTTTMSAELSNINETSGEGYDFTKIEILEVLSLTELEVDNKLRLISDSTSKAPTPTIKETFWDDLVADFLNNITDSDYEKYYCLDEESLNTLQDQLAGISIDVDDYIFSDLNDVSGVLFTLKPSVALGFTNQHQILSKDNVVLKVKFAKVYTLASTQLSEEVTPTFENKDTWCYDGVNKKYRNVHLLGVKPTMSKCVIA